MQEGKQAFGDYLKEKADKVNYTKAMELANELYPKMKKHMDELASNGIKRYEFNEKQFKELYRNSLYLSDLIQIITNKAKEDNMKFYRDEVARDEYVFVIDLRY